VEKRLAASRDSRDLGRPWRLEFASDFLNSASFFGSKVSGSNSAKIAFDSGELLSNTLPSILNCCFMFGHSTFPPDNVPVNFDLVSEMFLQHVPELGRQILDRAFEPFLKTVRVGLHPLAEVYQAKAHRFAAQDVSHPDATAEIVT